jgi:hypothetical protein
MKTRLLLFIFFNFTYFLSYSQEKDCVDCSQFDLIYDFNCKKFKYYENEQKEVQLNDLRNVKLKYKKAFRFKIINLNRYLYTPNLQYDDINLESEIPALLTSGFIGSGVDLSTFFKTVSDSTADEKQNEVDSLKTNFIDKFRKFKNEYDKLIEKNIQAYSLCLPNEDCCNDKKLSIKFTELSTLLFELRVAYTEANSLLVTEIDSIITEIAKTEKELIKEKNKKKIKELEEKLKTDKKNLNLQKSYKLSLEVLKTDLDKITDSALLKLIHFENNLIKNNFEYISPTIYPSGDRFMLNVKISPSKSTSSQEWMTMPLDSDEFSIEFRVRNKWFFSFSSGPFIGIGNKFKTENYDWKNNIVISEDPDIDDSSTYELVRTRNSSLPIGLAGFANFGVKTAEYVGIGGSIGVGTTLNDNPQIAYFIGGTLFLGQDKQFNLTTGFSFIQVETLKKELYQFDGYQYSEATNLKYDKKMVNGWFFSLSYTIFNPTKTTKLKTEVTESETTSE